MTRQAEQARTVDASRADLAEAKGGPRPGEAGEKGREVRANEAAVSAAELQVRKKRESGGGVGQNRYCRRKTRKSPP